MIAQQVAAAGIEWDAVGGLTLGADQFAHGIVTHLRDDHEWFVVRKQPKGRGTNQLVEGAKLGTGVRVLLVDRSDIAAAYFEQHGVTYLPVFTYHDLGIVPVGLTA